MSHTRN